MVQAKQEGGKINRKRKKGKKVQLSLENNSESDIMQKAL